jgi:hypothetical protein
MNQVKAVYYTIYQINNLVNGKIYIGKHITSDLDDDYMGSGKHLRRAIAKYGIENFQKDILFVFDNEADMNTKEAELVTAEFVLEDTNYNLCVGGQGGFSYINTSLKDKMKDVRRTNLAKIPVHVLRKNAYNTIKNRKKSRGFTREENIANSAKAWSDSAREKRAQTKFERKCQQGKNNSQYGTRWITNGSENRKIKKTDIIPEGWYAGRK